MIMEPENIDNKRYVINEIMYKEPKFGQKKLSDI